MRSRGLNGWRPELVGPPFHRLGGEARSRPSNNPIGRRGGSMRPIRDDAECSRSTPSSVFIQPSFPAARHHLKIDPPGPKSGGGHPSENRPGADKG
ncbi:Hypothetical protein NTJ_10932 [Nesidiocoris tenuis]|uniref:Uncharacterized protein n=1 Tax=Nesidiocoris tenuis TaxID=355587 RepID=A0ABN7B3A8_9HEMI|nr:Hypothetical protein NTJ_10932 [Nesidiocoris tenuis]